MHRLTLEAEHAEERDYLRWLTNMMRSGNAHQQYLEDESRKPDALQGLSDDDIRDARWLWAAICGSQPVPRKYAQMIPLQEKGWIRDLEQLPGRGRYAGRFEFYPTDKLQIIVLAASEKRATKP